eukprot:COSAG06_NODE_49423_length_325_cov_1.185841_1_plen_25_part_10
MACSRDSIGRLVMQRMPFFRARLSR